MGCFMRIMIISPYFAPSSAVGAARMTSLADYLASNGYLVDVISWGKNFQLSDKRNRTVPDKVNIFEVNSGNGMKALEKEIEALMRMNAYSVLISSMGPFETIKFVPEQCQKWRVPYILDYRDAWLFYPFYYKNVSFFTKLKRFIKDTYYLRFEWIGVQNAAYIVTVTDRNADILKKRYERFTDKIVTIYNGHEKLPEMNSNNCLHDKEYTIGCAGKFLYYNEPLAISFLKTLSRLRARGLKIKLLHIGNNNDDATEIIKKECLDPEIYLYLGQYNYDDAMRFLSKQNAGLIIYAYSEGLGTKVFDYIGLNKPIVYYGVCPSELSEFVLGFKNVVVTSDPFELEVGLNRLIDQQITTLEDVRRDSYSRAAQNERYRTLIEKAVENGKTHTT